MNILCACICVCVCVRVSCILQPLLILSVYVVYGQTLRVAYNSSDLQDRLLLDQCGNPGADMGRLFMHCLKTFGGCEMSLTQFRTKLNMEMERSPREHIRTRAHGHTQTYMFVKRVTSHTEMRVRIIFAHYPAGLFLLPKRPTSTRP